MAATNYNVNISSWTDCGAADDCILQVQASAVIFTVAATIPAIDTPGLLLAAGSSQREATILRPGQKLWVRATERPLTVTVER